jgi:uncharacterized protein YprB with RNaseH-like and TPR domain
MRIAFFDVESTDLKGMMARILCASILPLGSKPHTLRLDDRRFKGRSKIDDSKLVAAIRDELETYNLVVGWNSKLFDIPLINSKLAKSEQRPCALQFHLDLMWYAAGSSMRIGSRKLDNVAKFFKLTDQKTELDWDTWQLAGTGDKPALDYVVRHCEADVKVTAGAYKHLLPYVRNLSR